MKKKIEDLEKRIKVLEKQAAAETASPVKIELVLKEKVLAESVISGFDGPKKRNR